MEPTGTEVTMDEMLAHLELNSLNFFQVPADHDSPLSSKAKELIDRLYTYEPWDDDQQLAGAKVRDALKAAHLAILTNVPPGPTRTRALNMLTDCRMLANQAITFRGEV